MKPIPGDNIDWVFIVKKRLSWTSEMLQLEGLSRSCFEEALGVPIEFKNARMVLFHEYLDSEELRAFDDTVMREQKKDPGFLHKVATKSYALCEQFASFGSKVAEFDWARASRKELSDALREFHHRALLMIPVVYFEPNVTDIVKGELEQTLAAHGQSNRLGEYFLILTSTSKELLIVREQRDLLRLAILIQEQMPALADRIRTGPPEVVRNELPRSLIKELGDHVRKYSWINTDDLFGRPWDDLDLLARLRVLLRKNCRQILESALQRQSSREKQAEEITRELGIRGDSLKHIEIARQNSHLRTHRTETYVHTFFNASSLIAEVARRIGLSYKDSLYLSLPEIEDALDGKSTPAIPLLEERKSGMAYVMVDRVTHTFFGHSAQELARQAGLLEESEQRADRIEGMPANLGVVRGTVKVVHDISELGKVDAGDILVASMTIPEFVPAMEKAAAFVTDEGGITCHAAIVSREMGVPCIIGTEIATKALKDGDFVEVNADQGVVAVLSRN